MKDPDGGTGHASSVRLSGLTRRVGPVEAVRDLTLEIDAGQTLGLLGPNGALSASISRSANRRSRCCCSARASCSR